MSANDRRTARLGGARLPVSRNDFANDLLGRRSSHFFSGLFHDGLEVGASLFPGALFQRDRTIALAFAGVLCRVFTTPALPLAGVLAMAGVGFGGRTFSLAGAIIAAALPLALAGIQPATGVRLLHHAFRIRLLVTFLLFLLLLLTHSDCSADQPSHGGDSQKPPAGNRVIVKVHALVLFEDFFVSTATKIIDPVRHSRTATLVVCSP
jgi:hypothetical protein